MAQSNSETTPDSTGTVDDIARERHRHFDRLSLSLFGIGSVVAIALAVNQLFNLSAFGVTLLDAQYLFLLAGIFLALTFLAFPTHQSADLKKIPWFDWILAIAALVACGYFVATSHISLRQGWEFGAPLPAQIMSGVLFLLILECTRRTGGPIVFGLVAFFGIFPIFADKIPGPISGFSLPLVDTISFHIISVESAFGIPMKAFGQIVVGFIVFGAALQFTGGGRFFNDLALSVVGRYRGGAAKVSIFASGLMGSMSGSVVSNVLTTGAVSIPAMRRTGFSRDYAAGTEACASTGGVLMPPVMGTTAFLMASFLGTSYANVILAAAIPSLLFYFGLFVQLDAYAARKGLQGLEADETPRISEVFRNGWQYIIVFAVLIFMLLVWRQEKIAPFYATALLLVINQAFPSTRLSWRGLLQLAASIGRSLAELVALLLGVGLIVGSFSATGLAGTLVNDLVFLAGNAVLPLLIMGAITAFIFGMGMTVTACYIFLAIVLAPALTQLGLNTLAVHLFILYWGMVSFITPPVALGAFAGASLAGTSPMKASFAAMRLGSVIYIVPFFFVLNPALIGQGSATQVVPVVVTALLGVFFLGSALQGYIAGFGMIRVGSAGFVMRGILFLTGLLMVLPGAENIGLNKLHLTIIAGLVALPILWDTKRLARFVESGDTAHAPAD